MRTGKSLSVEEPVYPDSVRFIRNGKEAGSEMTILYCLETVTFAPPAEVPVAVTVKFCEPTTLVEPSIIPVAELIDNPGGKPVAEKEPLPEKAIA